MNIAIFSDAYIPIKNGVTTSVVQLKEGLEKRGHNVIVITVDVPDYEEKDPNVYRLPSINASFGSGTDARLGFLFNYLPIIRFLKKKKIDIIHTHTEFTIALYGKRAAKKLKLPLVQSTHTMWEEYRHYILNGKIFTRSMVRKMMSTFMKNAYCLVCPSIKAEKYYKGLLPNISTVVINNGIDVDKFKSSTITENEIVSMRKTFDFKKNEKILLFVGRIGNEKRVLELFSIVVPILKENTQIKMIFVGAGPLVDHIADSAKRLGIEKQVVFTGFVNWDLVYRLYSISDLFVTASLSEVQPMTLIEASMCGMPIIVRRDDSYLDLVHDGKNGYIVDSDEEMAAKIRSLIYDDEKLKEFSEYSLKNSSKFTAENHVIRMEKFYQEVLKTYPNKFDCQSFMEKN